jgi:hypothetical protein
MPFDAKDAYETLMHQLEENNYLRMEAQTNLLLGGEQAIRDLQFWLGKCECIRETCEVFFPDIAHEMVAKAVGAAYKHHAGLGPTYYNFKAAELK